MKTDYRKADLDSKTMAILEFSDTLTREPSAVREEHIEKLRSVGLTDEEILDVVLIASRYNFVNRVTIALGVELDERFRKPSG